MSIPNFDFNRPDLHLGDTHDDDAEVLDNLVESKAEPPEPDAQPTGKVNPLPVPKVRTRLQTASYNVDPAWAPIRIAPFDPNRKSVHISCAGDNATDYILIADENGTVMNAFSAYALPVGSFFNLDEHNGAIWIKPNPTNAGTVLVSFVAVTE